VIFRPQGEKSPDGSFVNPFRRESRTA